MAQENVLRDAQNSDVQGIFLNFGAELLGVDGQTSLAIQEIVAMQYV